MKNSFIYLICVFVLFSCSIQPDVDDINNDQFSTSLSSSNNCEGYYALQYFDSTDMKIQLGKAHNDALADLDGTLTRVDSCTNNDLDFMINEIQDLIDNSTNYLSIFGTTKHDVESEVVYEIANSLNICELDSKSEYADSISNYLDDLYDEAVSTGYYHTKELNFLSDFIDKIQQYNGAMFDLTPFYDTISNNSNDFLFNGEISYLLLVIYEYSTCYWENYNFPQNNLGEDVTLESRFLMTLALTDLAGAFTGSMANLIRTDCQEDPDDNFFVAMGRGALAGSTFGASEIVFAFWD